MVKVSPIKKRLPNLFRQKYFLIISLVLLILIIGLAAYLLTSRQAGPLKEFFSPSSERQTLKQGPSFTQMISPSLIDGSKAVFYFKDSNLASEIYSQLDNAIMEDNNTIIIDGYDSSQPLVIAKSGDKPAKIFKTNGFLVELEKKSLLRQKADLSEENELNSELGKRVVSVSESIQNYAEEVNNDQERIKQEIEYIIGRNNAVDDRRISSASKPSINSFKNVFNGFLVNDISYKEVSKIRSIDGVKRVIPNYEVKANLYDSVPMINAPDLWTNGYTGKGVKIAVIDTGVDYTHADLGGNAMNQGGNKLIFEDVLTGDRLVLNNGQDINLSGNIINGLKAYFPVSIHRDQLVLEWKADDEGFITEESILKIPGLDNIYFNLTDIVNDPEETYGELYLFGKYRNEDGSSSEEAFKLEKASNKFNIGEGLWSLFMRLDKDNLPNMLKEGKYQTYEGDFKDYEQKIFLGNLTLRNFSDMDYKYGEPTVGIRVAHGDFVLNYTLKFMSQPYWGKLNRTVIEILGRKYYVSAEDWTATFNSKVVGGYDFVNNDEDPMDDNGHGTHCAATAAGNGNFVREIENPASFSFFVSGDDTAGVRAQLHDYDVELGVLYGNGTHFNLVGLGPNSEIAVSYADTITVNQSRDSYFVVSNIQFSQTKTAILELSKVDDIDGITVRDYSGNTVASDKRIGSSFDAADITLTVDSYSQADNTATFSISGGIGNFYTIYDKYGYHINLPPDSYFPASDYTFNTFDEDGFIKNTNHFYWSYGEVSLKSTGNSGGGGSGGGSGGDIPGTGSGLRGVAPDAELYAYKVLDASGSGWTNDIIAAFEKVVDPNGDGDFSDHMDIASMSFGAGCWEYDENCGPDDPMSTAVDNMVDNGVVAVVAAGNNGPGKGSIGSPGTARKAITVGAVDKQKRLASFSSRGPVSWSGGYLVKPDVVAPGVSICAAKYPDVSYGKDCFDETHLSISGTSMATPHVAGAAALLLQKNPSWNPADVKSALMIGAEKLDYKTNEVGAGLIDVNKSSSLTLLISPYLISFETIVEDLPRPQKFTISNYNEYPLNISLDSDFDFTVLSENEFILEPNSSKTIWLTIFRMPQQGGLIEGYVHIDASGDTYEIPFMVNVLSKIIVRVITGQSQPHFDIGIVSHNFDYWDNEFEATSPYTFLLPPGEYSVYAGGDTEDFDSVEYLMMKSFSVGNHETKNINLDISETKELHVNAKSLQNTPLVLYEWKKAFTAYTPEGCKFSYSLDDPGYGDRTVHVFKKPDLFESDILFKYIGVPSLNAPLSNNPGSSREFSWQGCSQ